MYLCTHEFGNIYFPGAMQAKPGYMGSSQLISQMQLSHTRPDYSVWLK